MHKLSAEIWMAAEFCVDASIQLVHEEGPQGSTIDHTIGTIAGTSRICQDLPAWFVLR